jgi:hypothetical protein
MGAREEVAPKGRDKLLVLVEKHSQLHPLKLEQQAQILCISSSSSSSSSDVQRELQVSSAESRSSNSVGSKASR